MKRFILAGVLGACLLAAVGASAVAQASGASTTTTTTTTTTIGSMLQLGVTKTPLAAPVCPASVTPVNCTIVLTRSTALETVRDGVAYPTTVHQAGLVVAFTVGLSRLSTNNKSAHNAIHFLDQEFKGNTEVAITVLKPVGAASLRDWEVVGESPAIHVQPWLGYVVQFPLATPLPVAPGDVIALTVPTWAPVLSFDLTPSKFAYRQSRSTTCATPAAASVAQAVGNSARYLCDYTGTRVEYSATEITTPAEPANQLHAPDIR